MKKAEFLREVEKLKKLLPSLKQRQDTKSTAFAIYSLNGAKWQFLITEGSDSGDGDYFFFGFDTGSERWIGFALSHFITGFKISKTRQGLEILSEPKPVDHFLTAS